MQTNTILLLVLAVFISSAIVFYQYYFKTNKNPRLQLPLSFLRFLALLGVCILLINPKITKTAYTEVKHNLVFLWDNSTSIKSSAADETMLGLQEQLMQHDNLATRFNISSFSFGNDLSTNDTLTFSETTTNIAKALTTLSSLFRQNNTTAIVVTDGNQTIGEDYEYLNTNLAFPVFPVVVGDTTRYVDLKINRINLNKYAFLNNTFPVEVYISYEGKDAITASLSIQLDRNLVYSETFSLDSNTDSKKITVQIKATSVGFKLLEFNLRPLEGERNKQNNSKTESIEVIDEKTNIGIVTSVMHPDIGTLIKTIESNEQRSAVILKPNVPENELAAIDLFILYQPTQEFAPVYRYINRDERNTFTITGPKTDWRFLNTVQNGLELSSYNQTEEIFPVLNAGFGLFDIGAFSVEDFPPLEGTLGELLVTKSSENILEQRIKGVVINEPLLAIMYDDTQRDAFLFGENLWRWRLQSYRNNQNFDSFDELFGKLYLYLASNEKRERLVVDYELANKGANAQRIIATYFDATYAFDGKAELNAIIRNIDTGTSRNLPMELNNNFYEADISDLPSGAYTYTVSVSNEAISKSGGFAISDFSLEQQVLRSNSEKLNRLAVRTSGKLMYPENSQLLVEDLMNNTQYIPTQKSVQNVVSLIDFKVVLAIIITALTAEWFIRKYNGLI